MFSWLSGATIEQGTQPPGTQIVSSLVGVDPPARA